MHRLLPLIALLGSSLPAYSESCDGLGLRSPYLTQHFCAQLKEITTNNVPTRGMKAGEDIAPADPAVANWPDVVILQDAYRADPRKTLELIRRIKDAGGLTNN